MSEIDKVKKAVDESSSPSQGINPQPVAHVPLPDHDPDIFNMEMDEGLNMVDPNQIPNRQDYIHHLENKIRMPVSFHSSKLNFDKRNGLIRKIR